MLLQAADCFAPRVGYMQDGGPGLPWGCTSCIDLGVHRQPGGAAWYLH